jgi:phage gpG-like protein
MAGAVHELGAGLNNLAHQYVKAYQALRSRTLKQALMQGGMLVQGEAQRILTRPSKRKHGPPPPPPPGWPTPAKPKRTARQLRNSITVRPAGDLAVSVGTNLVYARIQEEGGTTRPHPIQPKSGLKFRKGKAYLYFYWWGRGAWVLTRRVNHPGSKIPPNPYLGPAWERKREAVLRLLRKVYAGPIFVNGEAL